ncbi:MAG: hypothetical protein LBB86_08870 [Oscillospiraceae bacterium]|jgi:hypothetical protein|nr:hypothetical protein [Oscillospiraceae bacterium]
MTKSVYDALSLSLSYLFMALGVAIVLCGAAWARADRRARKAAAEPGAEAVGYLKLTGGTSKRVSPKQRFPVPVEGTVGSARACDVYIPSAEIPGKAGRFTLTQAGMLLSPVVGGSVSVNGMAYRVPVLLDEDSRVEWGSLSFQLNLLDGARDLAAARITPPLSDGSTVEEEPPARWSSRLRRGLPLGAVESDEPTEADDSDGTDGTDETDETDYPVDTDDSDELTESAATDAE